MNIEPAVAIRQLHVPRRHMLRGTLGVVAALVAAAPFVASFLPGLETPAVATFTIASPTDFSALYASGRSLRVARAAGKETSPGTKPVLEGEVQLVPKEKKKRLRPGHESEEMMMDRVTKRTYWLWSLKGRFKPRGPKPWDPHKFRKVCIQCRLKSKQSANTKILNQVVEELRRISGKHPRIVKAKKNINAFQWRRGYPAGVAVTLMGPLMYDFLHRLNTIILPRVRDFEGLYPNSFDNYGNFWMGFANQEPFRELDELVDERELVHGFDIGIVTSCMTQPDGLALMKKFGFPFGDPRTPKPVKVKKKFSPVNMG